MRLLIFLCICSVSISALADSQSEKSREFSLFIAASEGKQEVIRKLLAEGADVNGKYYAETPLIEAIRKNRDDIVELLLKAGANPNLPNAQGTPLSLAAGFIGNPHIVNLLLIHGADANLAYEKDPQKQTPLGYLTWIARYPEAAQIEITRLLLKADALVDQESVDGRTPLRNAITWNKTAIAKILLEAGANPNKVTDVKFVDFETGEVPLHTAIAQYGRTNETTMVRLLLDFGANPNYQNNRVYDEWLNSHKHDNMWSGISPLVEAAETGHIELVKLLLERGKSMC